MLQKLLTVKVVYSNEKLQLEEPTHWTQEMDWTQEMESMVSGHCTTMRTLQPFHSHIDCHSTDLIGKRSWPASIIEWVVDLIILLANSPFHSKITTTRSSVVLRTCRINIWNNINRRWGHCAIGLSCVDTSLQGLVDFCWLSLPNINKSHVCYWNCYMMKWEV